MVVGGEIALGFDAAETIVENLNELESKLIKTWLSENSRDTNESHDFLFSSNIGNKADSKTEEKAPEEIRI